MDFAAIRSRLAGSEGRLYWRSLSELADTPDFRDYLHREFPEQASEWNDPKGRRNALSLESHLTDPLQLAVFWRTGSSARPQLYCSRIGEPNGQR